VFTSVLIANRGEIAVRITRTLHARGLRAVAVHTDPDADAPHVLAADVAVRVPDYLDGAAIIAAGRAVGADAVHPGYGFLAENAAFARQVTEAGMTWIGPPPEAIEAMGDKIRAKATVGPAGVPLVPGSDGSGLDDEQVAAAARAIGFPVLLKPSAGGGGKGMHVVEEGARDVDLMDAIGAARREARGSFGDDTLLVERYVTDPRHVEIQVLADAHGTVVHLGERECSLQRRHQKVVEEAPSAVLGARQRHAMGAAAVEAARACGYVGAGTVEFVTNADASEFFFLEMNTRLQVEHPVTEEVVTIAGRRLDLVAEQLRIAAGEPLGYDQGDIRIQGHAVEVRLYAEDPARGFLPTGGTVLDLVWPGGDAAQRGSTQDGDVRVDAGVAAGTEVGSRYDPMLAKVIAGGPTRAAALDRLDAALAATTVLGVRTNLAWLRTLLAHPDVRAGHLDTGLIGRLPAPADATPDDVLVAAALAGLLDLPAGDAPFDRLGGWRLGADPAPARWRLVPAAGASGDPVDVAVAGPAGRATVTVGAEGTPRPASAHRDGSTLVVTLDGTTRAYRTAVADGVRWLARDGDAWALREQERLRAARTAGGAEHGPLTAPMPGTVTSVEVAEGDHVTAGQRLVVVEAMKMEHVVSAPTDGVVKDLAAKAGAAVALDAPLVTVVPDPGE
jgi:acetyl-CoA/propionyl-CoA carboxylase, biotin carboxylase, biotin carboxyl carrier protein